MSLKEKIAQIQKELGVMKKDTEGYNYKYFDINQVLAHLQPLLEKHKVLLTQPLTVGTEGKTSLNTILQDLESDEALGSGMVLPDNLDPQKLGAAITYFRRYSLVSLFAMQAEDDDAADTKVSEKASDRKARESKNAKAKAEDEIPF